MTTPAVTPLGPVQAAIYQVLTGDATLMGMVTGVYDAVPEGAGYPYVVIGEAMEVPAGAHDRYGRETVETLHIWSDYRGFAQSQQIASRVVALLDHQPLTIDGHHHVATRYEFAQQLRDPAGPNIRHTVLRFRVLTEQV